MARPQKKGVDYFPHDATHGKTLFVLEQRWGNDGYATWFKILEALAFEDGHYLDLRDEATKIHLAARCRITPEVLLDILGTLAALGAISSELWRVSSVVWCQNFVNRVNDAYRLRKGGAPQEPAHFLVSSEKTAVSSVGTRVSSEISAQMKLKEIKGNKIKQNHSIGGVVDIPKEVEKFKLLHLETCGLTTLPPLKIFDEILQSGKPPGVIEDVYLLHGGDIQKYRQRNIVERLTAIRDNKPESGARDGQGGRRGKQAAIGKAQGDGDRGEIDWAGGMRGID